MTELRNLDQAAAYLTVSRRTLNRLIAAGRIRTLQVSAGRKAIEVRELEAYLAHYASAFPVPPSVEEAGQIVEAWLRTDRGKTYRATLDTPAPDLTLCFEPGCTLPGHVSRVHEAPDGVLVTEERLARALEREIHIDEAHGFPPGFGPQPLAQAILSALREAQD